MRVVDTHRIKGGSVGEKGVLESRSGGVYNIRCRREWRIGFQELSPKITIVRRGDVVKGYRGGQKQADQTVHSSCSPLKCYTQGEWFLKAEESIFVTLYDHTQLETAIKDTSGMRRA